MRFIIFALALAAVVLIPSPARAREIGDLPLGGRAVKERKEPDNVEALRRLASVYQEMGCRAAEEEVRRRISSLEPSDEENLRRLEHLMAIQGLAREEIITCRAIAERFHRVDDLKRLAYLYGKAGDRYHQLLTWQTVLRLEPRNRGIKRAYRRVYREYRREQGLYDELRINALSGTEEAERYLLFENSVQAAFGRPFLFEGGAMGVELQWRSRSYLAKEGTEQTGNVSTASAYYGLTWQSKWKGDKNRLDLRGGILSVEAADQVRAAPGLALDARSFPWSESRSIGGGALVYNGEYAAHLSRGLVSSLLFRRDVADDLDAYVRLITRDVWGAGLEYRTTDNISLSGRVEWAHLSDSNNLQNIRARLEYPLWSSGSLYDLEYVRTGYLRAVPDSSLKVGYEVEYINHDFVSPYYKSYRREWQNRILASGSLRLGKNLYLQASASIGRGQALDFDREYRAGILHAAPGEGRMVGLSYFIRETRMNPGAQVNMTYEGDGRFRGVEFRGSWKF
jgi:hypothetical protein